MAMGKHPFLIASGYLAAASTAAATTSRGRGRMKMKASFVHHSRPQFGHHPATLHNNPLPLRRVTRSSSNVVSLYAAEDESIDPLDLLNNSAGLPSPPSSSWGVADDWDQLSSGVNAAASASFSSPNSSALSSSSDGSGRFDVLDEAKRILEEQEQMMGKWDEVADDGSGASLGESTMNDLTQVKTSNDDFVENAVDMIASNSDYNEAGDVQLYDTASSVSSNTKEKGSEKSDQDRQEDEIAFMIRCNQSPQQLLISQGKALPELTDEMKYSPKFLLEEQPMDETQSDTSPLLPLKPKATAYFEQSIKRMFDMHSVQVEEVNTKVLMNVLDKGGISKWMTKCISSPLTTSKPFVIGPYDQSVSAILSRYSQSHGSGRLTLEEFQELYLEVVWAGYIRDIVSKKIVLDQKRYQIPSVNDGVIIQGKQNTERMLKQATLSIVWRDLEAHEIFSPVEEERVQMMLEMERLQATLPTTDTNSQLMMDECVLFDEYEDRLSHQISYSDDNDSDVLGNEQSWDSLEKKEKSSHQSVEMGSDGKTPKRVRDGQFVFIDEESCIGCVQCAQIAPSSFTMIEESGRARTYSQSNSLDVESAVMACPVDCMHFMSFDELEEMETSRDDGDGRTDHRHFGNGRAHTPLSVAGMDSDANHKSSWYHYLKWKCHGSSCPQRGCYDCPSYNPGENPFFIERHKQAELTRAKDFMESGEADKWRKVVEM